ncbi:MAG TPA: histidinol-phosphate transaminase [Candidatus Binataceae bacterium]|jgi:histidinol-phosphate aminotransferase|nr:histidinol-phosphate transaminase [Candidatus Binataceae bacterium]
MFRRAIASMAPYVPGEQPRPGQELIKLNTNENPYPPSPKVRRAILAEATASLRLYPAPNADAFIDAAARAYRVRREMIIAGNGSDELLSMLFRAIVGVGDKVAYPQPTYSLYDTLAAIAEASVARIPLEPDYRLPLDCLADERARLTIVCSPNSPCGAVASHDALAALARALSDHLLVVDEAYVDFAESNALDLVRTCDNVIVLRTLSKSFSLAGMRLGLAFANPAIIQQLRKVKDSYNLNRLAIVAGAAALADLPWMRRNVERVRRTRALTERRLRALGFEVPPSQANFVLARLAGYDLAPLAAALRRRGILVRHFPKSIFRDALRVSIGRPSEMRALFDALAALLPSFHRNAERISGAPAPTSAG